MIVQNGYTHIVTTIYKHTIVLVHLLLDTRTITMSTCFITCRYSKQENTTLVFLVQVSHKPDVDLKKAGSWLAIQFFGYPGNPQVLFASSIL
jgi:hypothetical protein